MARATAILAGALLAAGSHLLFAALLPRLPGGHVLARVGVADTRLAPLVAIGLALLAGGTLALLLTRLAARGAAEDAGLRRSATLAAIALPLAGAVVVAIRSGSRLLDAETGTPEVVRLLAVAWLPALLVAPAAAWVALSPTAPPSTRRLSPALERAALAALLAAFGLVVGLGIAQAAPFSWDESVYALTSRHWVQGTPSTGWGAHRPPVLSVLGIVPLAFGTDEALFRLIGLLFGLGAVAATWFLARGLAGAWAGLLAGATVAAAPSIQIDAGLFLNDVPAAALLVLLVGLLWRIMERPGPVGWQLLWLAPLAAAAFYVRYGSILPLAAIAVGAMLVWPARLAAAWPKVVGAALLLVALLVPHAAFAVSQTGSPVGVFLLAQGGASGAYLGAGLVQYAAWLPWDLVGTVAAFVAVVGLLGGGYRLLEAGVRRRWDAGARATTLLVVPAVLHVGVLGLFQLPQARYLFLPALLLIAAGSVVTVDALRARARVGRAAAAAMGAAVVLSLLAYGAVMPARAEARATFLAWEREVGQTIRQASDGSCSVLASDFPQMTWYSGCPSYGFAGGRSANRDRLLTGEDRFLVLRRDGRFQPQGAVLAEYLSRVDPGPVATFANRSGAVVATLYRFR